MYKRQVRILTLSHPARRNALDDGLLTQLQEALAPAGPRPRAMLIRGEGPAFCAGYDLNRLPEAGAGGPLPDAYLMETLRLLEACPWPTVAMIRGPAYGAGCDLALACDFRLGAPDAVFCLPPAKLGIAYAPDGLQRALGVLRRAFVKQMLFTGEPVRAERALAEGLLGAVHPAETLEQEALALCETLAARAPLALAGMKETLRRLTRSPLTIADVAELEVLRREAYLSEDAKEGRAAFLAKRSPRFTGR